MVTAGAREICPGQHTTHVYGKVPPASLVDEGTLERHPLNTHFRGELVTSLSRMIPSSQLREAGACLEAPQE